MCAMWKLQALGAQPCYGCHRGIFHAHKRLPESPGTMAQRALVTLLQCPPRIYILRLIVDLAWLNNTEASLFLAAWALNNIGSIDCSRC